MKKVFGGFILAASMMVTTIGCSNNTEDGSKFKKISLEQFESFIDSIRDVKSPYNAANVKYESNYDYEQDEEMKYIRYNDGWITLYGSVSQSRSAYLLSRNACFFYDQLKDEFEHMVSYSIYKNKYQYKLSVDMYDTIGEGVFNKYGDVEYMHLVFLDEYQQETNHFELEAEYLVEDDKAISCDILAIKDMFIEYDEDNDAYSFLGFNQRIQPKMIRVPDVYDDGVHGEKYVTYIDLHALYYSPSVTRIYVPEHVDKIETLHGWSEGLGNSSFSYIEVDEDNLTYSSYDECLYSKDYTKFLMCPVGRSDSVSINYQTKTIEANAFANCQKVKQIFNWGTVETIRVGAFSNSSFENLVISNSVTTIENIAFVNCKLLKTIVLSDGLDYVRASTIANCESLEEVTIGHDAEHIYTSVIGNCPNLKKIKYNGTVEEWNKISIYGDSWKAKDIGSVNKITCTDGEVNIVVE